VFDPEFLMFNVKVLAIKAVFLFPSPRLLMACFEIERKGLGDDLAKNVGSSSVATRKGEGELTAHLVQANVKYNPNQKNKKATEFISRRAVSNQKS
jgi:hypothetical protein